MANKQRTKAKAKTCLITGFDRFGKSKYNPSELVARALPASLKLKEGQAAIAFDILPTSEKGAWKTLKRAVASAKPDVLIMLGMAESRQRVSIERFALNIRDYRIADNEGRQPLDETIEPDAPDALRTTVPVQKLQQHLEKRGYPCEVSNHAGTFVCNDVYFRALARKKEKGAPRLILFVHLPMLNNYARTVLESSKRRQDPRLSRSRKLQLELLTNAVMEIARFCSEMI